MDVVLGQDLHDPGVQDSPDEQALMDHTARKLATMAPAA
jgi:hypothetical protein